MAGERLHLAHVAAEQPVLDLSVEEVRAVPADHRLELPRVRREQVELHAGVAVAQLLDQLVGLGGQPPGVDAEDLDARVELVRHVEQRDPVDLEGGGERDPRREALQRPLEQLLRLATLELDRELAGLEVVDQVDHAASASFSRARAGSRPTSTPSSSSLVRSQNARKSSRAVARGQPARRRGVRPSRRAPRSARAGRPGGRSPHAGRARRAGRRRRPGGACRPRREASCPGSRGRRPSGGRRRAGSRPGGGADRPGRRRSGSPDAARAGRAAAWSRSRRSCSAARRCRRSTTRARG